MSTIPILSVIDCDSIINSSLPKGTLQQPTFIGAWEQSDAYVFMITNHSFVVNDQGKSELTITAQVADSVQWTITSVDRGLQYNAILQGITVASGSQSAISTPQSLDLTFKEFTGPPQPSTVTPLSYSEYIMAATVENNNSGIAIQYYVTFYITDNQGNILGFYKWDPFIQVTN